MSELRLSSVSKWRGQGNKRQRVLVAASLELCAGEVALLEGPSGSGKTTLLGISAGLTSADEGYVVLAGARLASLSQSELRRHRARCLGFVFQRSNLLEAAPALDNVVLAGVLAGLTRNEAEAEGLRLLSALGVGALAKRSVKTLSGGEEQRVAIARALVHRPRVVLADEPTASLDGDTGRNVMQLLAELSRERRAAVLVATHDARIMELGNRRLRVRDGRLSSPASSVPRPGMAELLE